MIAESDSCKGPAISVRTSLTSAKCMLGPYFSLLSEGTLAKSWRSLSALSPCTHSIHRIALLQRNCFCLRASTDIRCTAEQGRHEYIQRWEANGRVRTCSRRC